MTADLSPTEALRDAIDAESATSGGNDPRSRKREEWILSRLRASGYELRPIEDWVKGHEQRLGADGGLYLAPIEQAAEAEPYLLSRVDYDDLRREQAAEAADREAAGLPEGGDSPPGTPAAVAPLDVERLAAALWSEQFPESPWVEAGEIARRVWTRKARTVRAAYAEAVKGGRSNGIQRSTEVAEGSDSQPRR